jgi:RNA polymerase sigma-70 factor (ECF subfamily)
VTPDATPSATAEAERRGLYDVRDRAEVRRVIETGDERAFCALYDRHTPYLYRLALRLAGGDAVAAEEITHDAWVRAAGRLAVFEGRSSLRTWLAGFVANRAREVARALERFEPLHEDLVADPSPAAGVDPALRAVDRVDLERAIDALPAGFRQVFVLHDIEGWTHAEIAASLSIDPGTSKSQLSRARAALRHALS